MDKQTPMYPMLRRHTTFVPELASPPESVPYAFDEAVTDLYGRGFGVQEIAQRIRQLYNHSISEAAIANITTDIQTYASNWQTRLLSSTYFVLSIEKMVFKVEEDGLLSDTRIWTASGIDNHGRQEIVGMWRAEAEDVNFWKVILTDLHNRGVTDVLVTSTAGCELRKPFAFIFGHSPVQITVLQNLRAASENFQGKNGKHLASGLKSVCMAENRDTAWRVLTALREDNQQTFGHVSSVWQRNWQSLEGFFSLGPYTRHVLYSAKPAADLYKRISLFAGSTRTFSNNSALMKAAFLALRTINEKNHASIRNWGIVLNELTDVFGERVMLR